MENPATWGRSERVIQDAYGAWSAARNKGVAGLSLARHIADALRDEGLLAEEHAEALSCLDVPEFHCRDGEHCNCPRCHLASAFPGFRDMSHDDAIEHWAREQDDAGEDHLRNEVDSQHMADYYRAQ